MTLNDLFQRLMTFRGWPDNWDHQNSPAPHDFAISHAYKLAEKAVTRFHFNPSDCVPSSTGGVALVWVHPNNDRYGDLECLNDGTVRACVSSKEHEILDEWQLSTYGIPMIGEKRRSPDGSLARILKFLQSGELVECD